MKKGILRTNRSKFKSKEGFKLWTASTSTKNSHSNNRLPIWSSIFIKFSNSSKCSSSSKRPHNNNHCKMTVA